jgi:hypothetical protein
VELGLKVINLSFSSPEWVYNCLSHALVDQLISSSCFIHFFSLSLGHCDTFPEALSNSQTAKMASFADEKRSSVEKIENANLPALNELDYDEEYSPEEQKRIIRRVDLRLVTITGLAYCVSLMDRTNLSNAAIAG